MKPFCGKCSKTALLSAALLLAITVHALADAPSRTLTMALLPIPDVLPSYVAQENGYFKEYGIKVNALPVASALERDQLMQAGKIDGMVNELAGTANFNRDKVRMQVVASARCPLGDAPLFRVLSAPQSGIQTISQLKHVPIAVSKNTIIEYITNRLLTSSGFSTDEINTRSVPVLPERMQLLLSGQIKAATLPDPLGASALKAGAKLIIDDLSLPERSLSVLSFSLTSLTEKTEAVECYVKAWMKGARDLNEAPEAYRPLMLKRIRVPKNLKNDVKIPPFPVKQLPSEAQWNDVMEWMIQKKLLAGAVKYNESVNGAFLK
ncbi:MAG: ABC transporter substrate-binding protein [Desulfobacter sp.]|nr:MAG: ABC transporter substrate-binding protein [Desulfobacter sp.]